MASENSMKIIIILIPHTLTRCQRDGCHHFIDLWTFKRETMKKYLQRPLFPFPFNSETMKIIFLFLLLVPSWLCEHKWRAEVRVEKEEILFQTFFFSLQKKANFSFYFSLLTSFDWEWKSFYYTSPPCWEFSQARIEKISRSMYVRNFLVRHLQNLRVKENSFEYKSDFIKPKSSSKC